MFGDYLDGGTDLPAQLKALAGKVLSKGSDVVIDADKGEPANDV